MRRFEQSVRFLRRSILALLVGAVPIVALAADRPDWAFPVTDKVQPPSKDDGAPKTAPGSDKSYTRKQIDMFQDGSRAGSWAQLMAQVVANLSLDDMLAVVAYTASRSPE